MDTNRPKRTYQHKPGILDRIKSATRPDAVAALVREAARCADMADGTRAKIGRAAAKKLGELEA